MIEYRPIDGQAERLPGFAAELIGLQVDAIVAVGTPAIRAAQEATDTIPIIMVSALDPVGEGFVASLAQPGRNITGVSLLAGQLTGKRLELLKEAVAGVSRVAGLWQSISLPQSQEAERAAGVLGVQLRVLEVRGAEDIERAFDVAAREHAEAVLVLSTPVTATHVTLIAELATARGLPAIFDRREFVEAGGLMSYGPNQSDQFRRAAYYVDRILKGTPPADLPVEQPREFELVINLRTAQALGLTIPQSVLVQATELLQ